MFSCHAARLLTRTVLALVLLTLAGALPSAQSLFGTLSGTVLDEQGGALPGADVTLTNQTSQAVQRTTSNAEGVFVFAAVPAGTYSVKIELQSFNSWEATDIAMRLGERRSLGHVKLKLGSLTETVSVTARPDIAPIDSGEKSARLTSEQIQNVPMVGRSTAELLKLLPGMTPISGGTSNSPGFNGEIIGINGNGDGGKQSAVGNFSGNGTRADALDIVIDGAHASDPGCNCATSVNPNPDMVGEFKVLQSNYAAEHAKGPITIDAVSKAGGREFHGIGLRVHARLPAELERVAAEQVQHEPGPENKPKNQFTYPGFNIGGPAADSRYRLQQEPGSGVLLHRIRVLPPEARYRDAAVLGADAGDARRRLQQHVLIREPRQLLRQHDADQSRERPRPGEPDRRRTAGGS